MKVFISGPMSGKPNCNREAFFKAQEELEKHGYSVWNPAWLAYPSNTEFTKDDMHIIDIAALRRCDAIYMLEGWKHSKGAQEEHKYAVSRGLMIMYEGVHCWGKEPEDEYDVLKRHIKTVEEALAWERWKNRLPVEAINVNQAINDVEADLDNFKDETDGKMNDIYDTLHRHGENIDTCQNDIDTCLNDMDCLRRICNNRHADNVNKINSLKKEVKAIKESIGTDNLQEQLEKDFADVYEEFQNTKDQVNDIEFGYIDWSSKMSSAIDEMEKVKKTVKGLNSLVATLGERNGILSDKLDDYKEAYMHLDNADEALERRIKALENNVNDIRSIVNSSDIQNISIKAMNDRMNLFSRELDSLSTAIDMRGKDIGSIVQKRCDDNRTINNTLNDLNIRLKAIEKRLSIKPFYAPTEDEKDD